MRQGLRALAGRGPVCRAADDGAARRAYHLGGGRVGSAALLAHNVRRLPASWWSPRARRGGYHPRMRLTDGAAEPRTDPPGASAAGMAGAGRRPSPSRWEVRIPALYAAGSAIWIAASDLLLASAPGSEREHVLLSIIKGFGFIAFTTGL